MLHAPSNKRIADYTPAKKFAPAGFCAFRHQPASGFKCYTLQATNELQITPLPKSLPLLGFVLFTTRLPAPASGFKCAPRSKQQANCNLHPFKKTCSCWVLDTEIIFTGTVFFYNKFWYLFIILRSAF